MPIALAPEAAIRAARCESSAVADESSSGEIKVTLLPVSVTLPGQANAFYERAISQHLRIGILAMDLLRREGARLHSRKLRSFDEPPFR